MSELDPSSKPILHTEYGADDMPREREPHYDDAQPTFEGSQQEPETARPPVDRRIVKDFARFASAAAFKVEGSRRFDPDDPVEPVDGDSKAA